MALPNERPFDLSAADEPECGTEDGVTISPCLSTSSRSSSSAAESKRIRACAHDRQLAFGVNDLATHLVDQTLLLLQPLLKPRTELLRRLPTLVDLLAERRKLVTHLVQLRRKFEPVVAEELVRAENRDPRVDVGASGGVSA